MMSAMETERPTGEKKSLRKAVRERLSSVPSDERKRRSAAICDALKSHIAVCGARVVALFAPLPDEPDISPLIDNPGTARVVLLPRVEGDTMQFYCYDGNNLSAGYFGVSEPQGVEPVAPDEIDVMVVPGVVFTKDGARMGRGKGFYDKYLSLDGFRALKIGVCFAEQVVDELPLEPHDVLMDSVVIM